MISNKKLNQKTRGKEMQLEDGIMIAFQLETESKSKREGEATRGENSDWIQKEIEKDRATHSDCFLIRTDSKATAKERQLEEKSLFDIELGIHSKSKREGEAARAENSV